MENQLTESQDINLIKKRFNKPKPSSNELVKSFWLAPLEAYFNQFTVAPVVGCSTKTLEGNRWRGAGIPFRKVGGRVLYKKSDVIDWLEGHALVISTSEYKEDK